MKSKKKRIIVIILAVTGTGLIAWLAFSLIADYRYRSLVNQILSDTEIALRSDAAFSEATTRRQDSCGQGTFKFTTGKTCTARIIIGANQITAQQANTLILLSRDKLKDTSKLYKDKSWDDDFKTSGNINQLTATQAFSIQNTSNRGLSACSNIATYTTSAEQDSKPYIDDTTLGDLEIRLSCTNTDWWTRNIMNRFFY